MILALFLLVITVQPQSSCPDAASCRALALEAQQRQDYEAFHDLAWAAYRKNSKDPELMLLLARAQSLSGRPGDALVMLERLAAAGVPTGAATDDDFARVRALPRWAEVEAEFSGEPASASAKASADKSAPAKASADKSAPAKASADKPSASVPASASAKASADKSAPAKASADRPSASVPLSFTTVLTPSALVYDAVSKRFIVADRKARRIAVVDGTTGGVATLVGAQGDLGEIGGLTIDPQQGDLWVASSRGDGAQLHRIQLISGRVLSSVPLAGVTGEVMALAFVRDAGLVLADDAGRILRVRSEGGTELLATLEYVPRALAADKRGQLYVSAGAPRLAQFTVGKVLRKIGLVELAPDTPAGAPFAVADGRVHFVVPVDGRYEIRSSPIQ